MLSKIKEIEKKIGNTPIIQLENDDINLFAKLELYNLMGSIKIRPAVNILKYAIESGEVNQDTTIIESSSGNFALALAIICRYLNLKFIAVIDKNINTSSEELLRALSVEIVKVFEVDHSGGYLLSRLQMVHDLCDCYPNSYWPNQYENPNNFLSHYYGTGREITEYFLHLDYIFLGVSSGGTLVGVSRKIKEVFSNVKVIAVDMEGSAIFGSPKKKRNIPGLGSSIVPSVIQNACIDEVMHISEQETVAGSKELLTKHLIFAGGSSGTVYTAVKKYFQHKTFEVKPNVLFICPDGGWPYINTIYSDDWVASIINRR